MSRVEELKRRRGDRPGCCATCRIAWCPCVIESHGGPGEVGTDEPVPAVYLVATERTMPAALEAGDPPGRSSGRTSRVLDDLLDSLVPGRERRAA